MWEGTGGRRLLAVVNLDDLCQLHLFLSSTFKRKCDRALTE